MPIATLVTQSDVTLLAELSRRLRTAAAATGQLAADLARLLAGVSWTGVAATAGRDETSRLARRLHAAGDTLGGLSIRAAHAAQARAEQLARRQAEEASLLHQLDRVVQLPGDLEARAHAVLHELHLGRAIRSLLP